MSSSPASSAGPDFGALAASYDRLRPADAAWHELFAVLVEEGALAGGRVLDVGCGTGQLTRALAQLGARAWGVDPSEEMLARARAHPRRRATFKRGRAEALPFKGGSFDAAVLRLVVHLLDRPRALPELARVLRPAGRAVITTFAPVHFRRIWLAPLFPSLEALDGARFPAPADLAVELRDAGFARVRIRPVEQRKRIRREEALERIRGRFISTLHLLDEDELAEGTVRAERELPAEVEVELHWAVLVAERAAPGSVRPAP
jgi:SAM-dependent methyltransferase